jgi:hypothetical protein
MTPSSKPSDTSARSKALCRNLLLVIAFGILGITACIIYRHASHFHGSASLIFYVINPLLILVLLIAAFRFPVKMQQGLLLALISLGFSLYAVEAGFFFVKAYVIHASPFERAAKQAGVPFDTRTSFQVVQDLRKEGKDAHTLSIWGMYTHDPLLMNQKPVVPVGGISNTVEVLGNETGEFCILQTDEHGFNNPPGTWSQKEFQIAVIGDSYVHGYAVKAHENFTHLLRQKYPGTLNLGRCSNGPLSELATLQEYIPATKPKVILWCYLESNDIPELQLEKFSSQLVEYLRPGFNNNLIAHQKELDQGIRAKLEKTYGKSMELVSNISDRVERNRLKEGAKSILKFRDLRTHLGLLLEEFSDAPLFRQVLSVANETAKLHGSRMYFVYIPGWERYGAPLRANPFREQVLSIARDLGLPIIDLHAVIQKQPDPLSLHPFRIQAHFTPEGHQLVAQTILETIDPELRSK